MTTIPRQRAVTLVNEALAAFEDQTGLDPMVILLPTVLYDRLTAERRLLASVMPDTEPTEEERAETPGRWVDVRVVDSPRGEIEVY